MTDRAQQNIAIALSGGGIRAMAFHLGVFKFLAEMGLLERVSKLSSVSGGSLLVGLILHHHKMRWPTSSEFLADTYPSLRTTLCHTNLIPGALLALLKPCNWRFLISRANLLAKALDSVWGIHEKVCDLPEFPEISFNGTTAENGKRFRFKRDSMGDYLLGYAKPQDFPLAEALAVSAAVPGVFGPLAIEASKFNWERRANWGAPKDDLQQVPPSFKRLHLYDGGVYDNLGIEPFFDCGKNAAKEGADDCYIIVSDAGAVLKDGFRMHPFNFMRLKRVSDIQGDQTRALRVRSFWTHLKQSANSGAYVYIAEPPIPSDKFTQSAIFYRTTLLPLAESDFDAIADRGHAVASTNPHLASLQFNH